MLWLAEKLSCRELTKKSERGEEERDGVCSGEKNYVNFETSVIF